MRYTVHVEELHYANAFRRSLLEDASWVAIDACLVHVNDSAACTEHVANRLGMIPLLRPGVVPPPARTLRHGGRPALGDEAAFLGTCTLDVTNHDRVPRWVTAADLRFAPGLGIEPAYPSTELVALAHGERLHLKGFLAYGQNATHPKFSPVDGVAMQASCGTGHAVSFSHHDKMSGLGIAAHTLEALKDRVHALRTAVGPLIA